MPAKQTESRDAVSEQRSNDRLAVKALVVSCVAVSIVALALFLWYSVQVILLIFAGILIAILLRGLADWVSEYTHLPHLASLAIVLLVLIGLLGGFFWIAAPKLAHQIGELVEKLPDAVTQLRAKMEATRLGKLLLSQSPQFSAIMGGRGDLLGSVTGIVSGTLGAVVSGLVVLFTGLFFALNPRMYVTGFLHLIPRHRRDRMAEVMGAIGYTLKWWMIGQAVDMVAIGAATAIGLWLLGIPLALVLGMIAALFNFIPNFGPIFSLAPAVLLALGQDPMKAVHVVLLFVVLQNLEGYILLPMIQRRAVDLPNAVTIISQVLMGILVGGLGLALAAPLAAAVVVAVKMLYVEDTLGDSIKTPADEEARDEVREVERAAHAASSKQKK